MFETYTCKGAVVMELRDGAMEHGRILLTEAFDALPEEITLLVDPNRCPTGCPYSSQKAAKNGVREVDDSRILNNCRLRDYFKDHDGNPGTYEDITQQLSELHKDNPRFQELLRIIKAFRLEVTYTWAWCGEGSWMKQAIKSTHLDTTNL